MPVGSVTQLSASQRNKRRVRRIVAMSTLPFLGIVAAFGIAPRDQVEEIPVQIVIESLDLPISVESAALDAGLWREERVQRGDTLGTLLDRLGVDDPAAEKFLNDQRETPALARLRAGRLIRAHATHDGKLVTLSYQGTDGQMFEAVRRGDGFQTTGNPVAVTPRLIMKSGRIQSSLFAATDDVGLPDVIATRMADIFSGEIDFHRDLRKGDSFSVVYEVFDHDGIHATTGKLLAVEFVNAGRSYRAVFFRDAQGREGYYTPQGQSLRKAFLRSPLEFSRVTSGFSLARYHPVLKEWHAHKGIDYGAPTGTRVRTVADGVIAFAGRQGGYGNLVVIQHAGQYSTAYGHLSGFGKGLRRGARVSQGQAIGFVGQTGLATGPHLHFEFRVAGVQKNPHALKLPTAVPMLAKQRPAFLRAAEPLSARLDLLRGTNLAALD